MGCSGARWTQGDGYPGGMNNAFKTVAKIVDNGAVCTFDGIDRALRDLDSPRREQ